MKKSNSNYIRSIGATDDKGYSIELVRSKEERVRGLNCIIRAYCGQIGNSK